MPAPWKPNQNLSPTAWTPEVPRSWFAALEPAPEELAPRVPEVPQSLADEDQDLWLRCFNQRPDQETSSSSDALGRDILQERFLAGLAPGDPGYEQVEPERLSQTHFLERQGSFDWDHGGGTASPRAESQQQTQGDAPQSPPAANEVSAERLEAPLTQEVPPTQTYGEPAGAGDAARVPPAPAERPEAPPAQEVPPTQAYGDLVGAGDLAGAVDSARLAVDAGHSAGAVDSARLPVAPAAACEEGDDSRFAPTQFLPTQFCDEEPAPGAQRPVGEEPDVPFPQGEDPPLAPTQLWPTQLCDDAPAPAAPPPVAEEAERGGAPPMAVQAAAAEAAETEAAEAEAARTTPARRKRPPAGSGGASAAKGRMAGDTTDTMGHTLQPPQQGLRVAVVGDGWGGRGGGYEAVVTEADRFTFTVVATSGDSPWTESHVLKEHCIFLSEASKTASRKRPRRS